MQPTGSIWGTLQAENEPRAHQEDLRESMQLYNPPTLSLRFPKGPESLGKLGLPSLLHALPTA